MQHIREQNKSLDEENALLRDQIRALQEENAMLEEKLKLSSN